ncbi:hypothetical protein C8R43DRAFT_964714 [Mycena crocata]|nr:hypothetical protein C8R43DRAFT_964714 [Mycena crocata]
MAHVGYWPPGGHGCLDIWGVRLSDWGSEAAQRRGFSGRNDDGQGARRLQSEFDGAGQHIDNRNSRIGDGLKEKRAKRVRLLHFDTVISIVGRLPVKLQPGMIDAAIAAGVRHFYPSELGGAITHGTLGKMRWFRDKVVTREHLQQRAREVHGFAYTLLVTGAFTETAVSIFNGVDVEKHTAAPYGSPDALLTVTALPDIVKYIVESVLLPLKPGQSSRELRVAGETLTWAKLMDTLGAVQGVRYTTTYLNVADAAAKQEESRVAGDADSEMVWAGKMVMATGVGRIPGPFDNARFSFTPESAKETLQRVFGKQ